MISLEFHDVAVVFDAPRWLVPLIRSITARFGAQRTMRWFTWLPRSRRPLGLAVFSPELCTIIDDGRHCLVQAKSFPQWTLYRALTDLQRFSWHGLTVDLHLGVTYKSPMIENRYR